MPCVVGGLATADLLPRKDDLVSGFTQQRLSIHNGCREDQVAEAGGEELNRHPSTLKLRFRRSVQHVGEGPGSFAAPREEAVVGRVAVVGTGIMGGPMARNLLRAGHEVTAWNRTIEKAEALEEEGARVAPTPADAVRDAEIVLTMLADARAVEGTMIESGALDEMTQDALWIQSGTIGIAAIERLAELAGERGITFVDAPVIGTKKPAEDGELFVLASGPEEARARCEPVLDAISRGHVWLGEAGLGTKLKLVANGWILGTIENLSETFVLAQTLGVDPRSFLEVISGGGMDMPYAHLKGEAILSQEFPPSFPLVHARKDVALILEAAGDVELPLMRATMRQFDRAFELGHGDEDMSAVYYACATNAGVRS
jgi:3-hydroxyisobutyrate dehydrogenase